MQVTVPVATYSVRVGLMDRGPVTRNEGLKMKENEKSEDRSEFRTLAVPFFYYALPQKKIGLEASCNRTFGVCLHQVKRHDRRRAS